MIEVTKINGEALVVNSLLIELIEATPDTVITLTTGRKIMVREQVPEVIRRAADYHRSVGLQPARPAEPPSP